MTQEQPIAKILVQCPHCGNVGAMPPALRGQTVQCLNCRKPIAVPSVLPVSGAKGWICSILLVVCGGILVAVTGNPAFLALPGIAVVALLWNVNDRLRHLEELIAMPPTSFQDDQVSQ